MPLHIFWDNSNILGCALGTRKTREPDVPWFAFRIHWRNLYALVTRGRQVETRCLAGSVPPECEDLWAYAEDLGFDVALLHRVESEGGGKKEQAVDEILHLKMANAVLDYKPPQTMILLSGDGSTSDFSTGFPGQVERALKRGWEVEVHAWQDGLSGRYEQIRQRFRDRMSIRLLDTHYENVTFVKGGEYYKKDTEGNKINFPLAERQVKPL